MEDGDYCVSSCDEDDDFMLSESDNDDSDNIDSDCAPASSLSALQLASPKQKEAPAYQHIFKEIVSSELAFQQQMTILQQRFVRPLQLASRHVLTANEHSCLFNAIATIMSFTTILVRKLNEEIECASFVDPSSPPDFSIIVLKVFTRVMKPMQPLYGNYCANKVRIDDMLDRLVLKNKRFRKMLNKLQSHPGCGGLPLESYLILPVQHICRYPLLFQQALDSMPPSHAHRKHCVNILAALRKTASGVDFSVIQRRESHKINSLLLRLREPFPQTLCRAPAGDKVPLPVGEEIILHRIFLGEHKVKMVINMGKDTEHKRSLSDKLFSRSTRKIDKVRRRAHSCPPKRRSKPVTKNKMRLLVFSDVIMLAKKRRGKLKVVREIPFEDMSSCEACNGCQLRVNHCLPLEHDETEPISDTYLISMKSEIQRNQLMKQITRFTTEKYDYDCLSVSGCVSP